MGKRLLRVGMKCILKSNLKDEEESTVQKEKEERISSKRDTT